MPSTSHAEVTWAGVQKAFENEPFFALLDEPKRRRLHQVLSRLRIEFDWYDIDLRDQVGTQVQVDTLEKLRKSVATIAQLRADTIPTQRGVMAALELAATQKAEEAKSRISEVQSAIDAIHMKAKGAGRIKEKELLELRRLAVLLDQAHKSVPFNLADPSAPSFFVSQFLQDVAAALPIIRDAKRHVRSGPSPIGRSTGQLSAIEWLSGVALPQLYERFTDQKFPVRFGQALQPRPGIRSPSISGNEHPAKRRKKERRALFRSYVEGSYSNRPGQADGL